MIACAATQPHVERSAAPASAAAAPAAATASIAATGPAASAAAARVMRGAAAAPGEAAVVAAGHDRAPSPIDLTEVGVVVVIAACDVELAIDREEQRHRRGERRSRDQRLRPLQLVQR